MNTYICRIPAQENHSTEELNASQSASGGWTHVIFSDLESVAAQEPTRANTQPKAKFTPLPKTNLAKQGTAEAAKLKLTQTLFLDDSF